MTKIDWRRARHFQGTESKYDDPVPLDDLGRRADRELQRWAHAMQILEFREARSRHRWQGKKGR